MFWALFPVFLSVNWNANVCSFGCSYCKPQILLMVARDFLQLLNLKEKRTKSVTALRYCRRDQHGFLTSLSSQSGTFCLWETMKEERVIPRDNMLVQIQELFEKFFMSLWEVESEWIILFIKITATTEEERAKNRNSWHVRSQKYMLSLPLLTDASYTKKYSWLISLF